MRRGFSFLVQKRCFKIADKKRSVALELTEDERFFRENDVDPTIAFIESLERERAVLEEKERQGEATAEWQEYDKEVEAVIHQIEHQWLTNPEPITKDSVKRAHKVMEEAVSKVQQKHQVLNDKRIAAYEQYKKGLLTDGSELKHDKKLPVSPEFARLLDKFK